jgi:hypothetical protein
MVEFKYLGFGMFDRLMLLWARLTTKFGYLMFDMFVRLRCRGLGWLPSLSSLGLTCVPDLCYSWLDCLLSPSALSITCLSDPRYLILGWLSNPGYLGSDVFVISIMSLAWLTAKPKSYESKMFTGFTLFWTWLIVKFKFFGYDIFIRPDLLEFS